MLSTLVVFIGIVNLFAGLAIIFLVLMQQGKGADAGASFGSGSSQGLFGAAGAANFLSRSTAIAATIFFITCLMLAYIAAKNGSVISDTKDSSSHSVPVHNAQNTSSALPSLPDAKNKEDIKRSLTEAQASQDQEVKQPSFNDKKQVSGILHDQKINKMVESSKPVRALANSTQVKKNISAPSTIRVGTSINHRKSNIINKHPQVNSKENVSKKNTNKKNVSKENIKK